MKLAVLPGSSGEMVPCIFAVSIPLTEASHCKLVVLNHARLVPMAIVQEEKKEKVGVISHLPSKQVIKQSSGKSTKIQPYCCPAWLWYFNTGCLGLNEKETFAKVRVQIVFVHMLTSSKMPGGRRGVMPGISIWPSMRLYLLLSIRPSPKVPVGEFPFQNNIYLINEQNNIYLINILQIYLQIIYKFFNVLIISMNLLHFNKWLNF